MILGAKQWLALLGHSFVILIYIYFNLKPTWKLALALLPPCTFWVDDVHPLWGSGCY